MKRTLGRLLFALLLVSLLGVGAIAETTKVGIVDLAIVVDESQAGIDATAQLNSLILNRQGNLDDLETQIMVIEASLQDTSEAISEEETAAMTEEIDRLVAEYMRLANQYETEIQNLAGLMQQQIFNEIQTVLRVFGEKNDYGVILDSSVAFYVRDSVDLTWQIIEEYNQMKAAGSL